MSLDTSELCPACETRLGYDEDKHAIGVNIWGAYDGVLYWICPVCDHAWHRWPAGSRPYNAAIMYVDEHNK